MIMRRGYTQRGFTLVEMVVTISTASILLTLATGVVHRVMRFESVSRQRASVHRAAMRLSHDFRHDVHRANGFEISDPPEQPTMRLTLPEGNDVTYQVTSQRVLREQQLEDQQVAREIYDFPTDYQVRFSRSAPRLAEISIVHILPLVGIDPQTVVHVETEVGRLQRLTNAVEDSP